MKSTANYISISRILLIPTLALLKPMSLEFYIIYLLCGVSDILDGYIARKTKTSSKFGEKLDSIADLIMTMVLFVILYPMVNPTFKIVIWILIIGLMRTLSMLVALVKYRTFAILHTYGNKITGLMLFLFPLCLNFMQADVIMYMIFVVASISAIEEFFIHLSSNELRANRKSIFAK